MSTTPNLPAVIPPKHAATPRQQLGDLPIEELRSIAEEFGISPKRTDDKATLIAAIHERRQRIASLERAALVDVLEWAHRPIVPGASHYAHDDNFEGFMTPLASFLDTVPAEVLP